MTDKIKIIASHHWLQHPLEQSFHAYVAGTVGTRPLCDAAPSIVDNMEIPGDRSKCCNRCFSILYQFNL